MKFLEYIFQFGLESSSVWTWTVLCAFFVSFVYLISTFYGKLWNKTWNIFEHVSFLSIVIFLGILTTSSLFILLTITEADNFFSEKKTETTNSITDAKSFKQSVILYSWEKLLLTSPQTGISSPDEGGNQIKLNNIKDFEILSSIIKQEVRKRLNSKIEFSYRNPSLNLKKASERTLEYNDSDFPKIIDCNSDCIKSIATTQIEEIFDDSKSIYEKNRTLLKTISLSLFILLTVITCVLCTLLSLRDIQKNP